MQNINWEKIGVYIACLSLLSIFWQSTRETNKLLGELRERIAIVETKIEKSEKK